MRELNSPEYFDAPTLQRFNASMLQCFNAPMLQCFNASMLSQAGEDAATVKHFFKAGLQAQETLDDPLAPHPDEIIVKAPAGSVAVLNAHVWHGGTLNVSGERRRVLHLSYCRRDEPQQLVQQDYVTPALYERMSDVQRYLLDIRS